MQLKKFFSRSAVIALAVSPAAVMAQDIEAISAAADGFSSTFSAGASAIGSAFLTAIFAALVWKWLKGFSFS